MAQRSAADVDRAHVLGATLSYYHLTFQLNICQTDGAVAVFVSVSFSCGGHLECGFLLTPPPNVTISVLRNVNCVSGVSLVSSIHFHLPVCFIPRASQLLRSVHHITEPQLLTRQPIWLSYSSRLPHLPTSTSPRCVFWTDRGGQNTSQSYLWGSCLSPLTGRSGTFSNFCKFC